MHNNLTYTNLPPWLLWPMLEGAISQQEAADLWDQWLLTPPEAVRPLPQHLHPAAERLNFWQMEVQHQMVQ